MDSGNLKEKLGGKAKNIILQGLNLTENREKKILCPLHAEKTPSMSWFSKGLMFRCHACQGKLDIYDYYMTFEHLSFQQALQKVADYLGEVIEPIKSDKKEFKKPNIKQKPLQKEFIEYMKKRKITKETLDYWKVKQRNWNGKEVYVFNHFNHEKKLEFVSYRGLGDSGIKGGCVPNTKPILWGMWHIDRSKPVVFTEGHIDCMSVWQSGYKNVVSVPNGSNNLKWIDNCWEWLEGIKEIIVWADNDKPGLEMANNVKTRLKNVKIITKGKNKWDANEILKQYGEKDVLKTIKEAINQKPPGILDVSEIEYKTSMTKETDGIETGFPEYDYHVEDWKPGEITVIFGRNGEGKTTFASQIISHCLEIGTKTFLYSGEMSEKKIQDWLYRQMIGKNKEYLRTIITKYKEKIEPKPEVIKVIKEWHQGKLFLFDRNEEEVLGNLDKFFESMEIASKRYGCKLFIIDNLMAILEENADSLFSDQANFVQRCKNFAINNNAHLVLLAHPNKLKGEIGNAEEGNLDKGDISGSNNIANKADNVIAVERLWSEDREFDALITSLKDRESGQRRIMKFYFSPNTLRFYNGNTKEHKKYSWEKILEKQWEENFDYENVY